MKTEDLKEIISGFGDKAISDCLMYLASKQTIDHAKALLEEAAKRLEQHA